MQNIDLLFVLSGIQSGHSTGLFEHEDRSECLTQSASEKLQKVNKSNVAIKFYLVNVVLILLDFHKQVHKNHNCARPYVSCRSKYVS